MCSLFSSRPLPFLLFSGIHFPFVRTYFPSTVLWPNNSQSSPIQCLPSRLKVFHNVACIVSTQKKSIMHGATSSANIILIPSHFHVHRLYIITSLLMRIHHIVICTFIELYDKNSFFKEFMAKIWISTIHYGIEWFTECPP